MLPSVSALRLHAWTWPDPSACSRDPSSDEQNNPLQSWNRYENALLLLPADVKSQRHWSFIITHKRPECFRNVNHIIQSPVLSPWFISEIQNQRNNRISVFLRELRPISSTIISNHSERHVLLVLRLVLKTRKSNPYIDFRFRGTIPVLCIGFKLRKGSIWMSQKVSSEGNDRVFLWIRQAAGWWV